MDTNSTRRDLLKAGIAAAGGPAVQPRASAQSNAAAVATKRRFRGWVSRGSGPGRARPLPGACRSGPIVRVQVRIAAALLGAQHPDDAVVRVEFDVRSNSPSHITGNGGS